MTEKQSTKWQTNELFKNKYFPSPDKQRWFSGRILACHAGGPGSIPGRCKLLSFITIKCLSFIQQGLRQFILSHRYQRVCHCTFVYQQVISAGPEALWLNRIRFYVLAWL